MSNEIVNYKTTLCWHYMKKGYCSLYEKCHFAHGNQQLRKKADPIPQYIPPTYQPLSIFKTQLCKYFMSGYCRNAQQCPFAHGIQDVRGMVVTSKGSYNSQTSIQNDQACSNPFYNTNDESGADRIEIDQNNQNRKQNEYSKSICQYLETVLLNLEQVFPEQNQKKFLIKKGLEMVGNKEYQEADDIIKELVNSSTLTDKQKEQCQTIMQNAYSFHKINIMGY